MCVRTCVRACRSIFHYFSLLEVHTQKELTDEERDQILHSSEFRGFIDRATRTVERALAEPSGLFINEWFGDGESLTG